MKIHLCELVAGLSLPSEFMAKLEHMIREILVQHNLMTAEVGVILAGDELLQQLNRTYRGIDSTTDVLAFNLLEPGELANNNEETLLLGDIYISLQRARQQAGEAGHHFYRELFLLAAHGMLHLLGYDHGDTVSEQFMSEQTDRILSLVALPGEEDAQQL